MKEFWEHIEGTNPVEKMKSLRKDMLREAMGRFREFCKDNMVDDDADEIAEIVDSVVVSCLVSGNDLRGWSSVYSTLYDDGYAENISVVEFCLPDFKFRGITKTYQKKFEDTAHTYSLWKYVPRGEDSAMVRYADFLLSLKASITDWLKDYFRVNPIKCVEGDYCMDNNPQAWVHFLNYASQTILRVVYGLVLGKSCCLKALSPYSRYAFIYTLYALKDALDIDVYYSDKYLNSETVVDKFNRMSDGVEFDYSFRNNFTKVILNLSESDWKLSSYQKRITSDFFLIVRKGDRIPVAFESQRMWRGLYKKL